MFDSCQVYFAIDGLLAGAVSVSDLPKPGAATVVSALRRSGLRVVMLRYSIESLLIRSSKSVPKSVVLKSCDTKFSFCVLQRRLQDYRLGDRQVRRNL